MRETVVIAVVALCLPAAALAAKPTHPATPANSHASSNANASSPTGAGSNGKGRAARVMFVLHGTLSGYTPASGASNGSIKITVTKTNRSSAALKGQTLKFPVRATTDIVLKSGTISDNDAGIAKVRAAKNTSVTDLQQLAVFQVIDHQ